MSNAAEKGLGSKVVKCLSEKLYESYRHMYFDNFFASVDLALDLLDQGCIAVEHFEQIAGVFHQH